MGYEFKNKPHGKGDLVCGNCNEEWTEEDVSGATCPNCGKYIPFTGPFPYDGYGDYFYGKREVDF